METRLGSPPPTSTTPRAFKLIRSSSLPNDIQDNHYQTFHHGNRPTPRPVMIQPQISRSEISSSVQQQKKSSAVPLLSLFSPPTSTPFSPPTSSFSPPDSFSFPPTFTASSTNPVGLPPLLEGRLLSDTTQG